MEGGLGTQLLASYLKHHLRHNIIRETVIRLLLKNALEQCPNFGIYARIPTI